MFREGLGGKFGWVFYSRSIVGVDLRERAEEQAIDVSEDGGAAWGNVVFGEKLVKVAEGVVDPLGGLEALGIADERGVDVTRIFLFFNGQMVGTQTGVLIGGEETALAARGSVKLAASRQCGGISGL